MFAAAMDYNLRQLRQVVEERSFPDAVVCDVGCWDGGAFWRYAPRNATLLGLELNADAVQLARTRGIEAVAADLGETWPLDDQSVDLITSNQVIEHVADTDHFVRETLRVLRPGGTAFISTENLASWHNIAALSLGWQPFSITNVSEARPSIGNPLANLRYGDALGVGWQHVRVFARRGLIELFEAHGFVDVTVRGAGYYPLPAAVGRLDSRHAAFITVVAQRSAECRGSGPEAVAPPAS